MMNKKFFIYLASKSPRRREILRRLKIPFRVIESSYHEKIIRGMKPEELVLMHAEGKAARARYPTTARFILGVDTLVYACGTFFGKPKSMVEARRMISRLSGRSHFVYTGIALLDLKMRRRYVGVAKTKVYFKPLKQKEVLNYLNHINPMDKAGAYAIQEGPQIVERIEGSRSNVIGLPRELLKEILKLI